VVPRPFERMTWCSMLGQSKLFQCGADSAADPSTPEWHLIAHSVAQEGPDTADCLKYVQIQFLAVFLGANLRRIAIIQTLRQVVSFELFPVAYPFLKI